MKRTMTFVVTILLVLTFSSNSYAQSRGIGDWLEKAKKKVEDMIDDIEDKIGAKLENEIKKIKKMVEQIMKEFQAKMSDKKKEEQAKPYPERGYNSGVDDIEVRIKDELGVKLFILSEKSRELLGLGDKGLMVVRVYPKSQADGVLKVGDVLTFADKQKLTTLEDLVKAMNAKKKQNTIKLTYMREGKESEATFKLKRKSDKPKKEYPKKERPKKEEPKKEAPKERKKHTEKEIEGLLEKFFKEGDKEDPPAPKDLFESLPK